MSIAPHIEHGRYKDVIYHTNFIGEREALERSDFLRPLLPPADRKHTSFDSASIDDVAVAHHVTSCHRKHGGIRIRVFWAALAYGGADRLLSRKEIIDLSRLVLAEIQEHDQDRINAAPEGWPFPVWGIAA